MPDMTRDDWFWIGFIAMILLAIALAYCPGYRTRLWLALRLMLPWTGRTPGIALPSGIVPADGQTINRAVAKDEGGKVSVSIAQVGEVTKIHRRKLAHLMRLNPRWTVDHLLGNKE